MFSDRSGPTFSLTLIHTNISFFLPKTSVLINDLATVYDEEGRYNKAERLAQKAIDIAKETSPENLPAYTYNLGAILMHKGM